MSRDLDAQASEIVERSYTVFERTHADDAVDLVRNRLEAVYREHGSPGLYSAKPKRLTPDVEISPTGFVILKLLKVIPELASHLLAPEPVEVVRRVLGRNMHIELVGAAISDSTRPLLAWHNHIGGIDAHGYDSPSSWPRFERSERVTLVLYLDDVDEISGRILTLPRRVTDPTEPPFDPMRENWEGQARLSFPRGSTLIFEQANWHAVEPKRSPGLRMFVGCYFTSDKAAPTTEVDESLANCRGRSELFDSVLPRER